jgi:predicted GNAT superfamily acetyltransferase
MATPTGTAGGPGRGGFRFRKLEKPEELRAAEEVQREALGMEAESPVPVTVQRAALDNGGQVLGAFADIYLAGVTVGALGWDGRELYHVNLVTAVRPEYQNHHVGFQLNAFLREAVLGQGLPLVRGVLDPLQSRAARLAIRRLGAVPDRYHAHYFGQLDSSADRGLETDRLRLRWDLPSPRVEARLAGTIPTAAEDEARWRRSMPFLETELSDEGLRRPSAVQEADRPEAHLEIPFDLGVIRDNAPGLLRPWRHAVRDAFRAAFDLGYRVEDFVVLNLEHERRSFYLLSPAPPEGKPGEAPAAGEPARAGPG